jgi:hypothetical protein
VIEFSYKSPGKLKKPKCESFNSLGCNKSEHIVDAVEAFDDRLRRMQAPQSKKTPMLCKLNLPKADISDSIS